MIILRSYILVVLIGLIFYPIAINADEKQSETIDPFSLYPFKKPIDLDTDISSYRSWSRLTGFEYSGLHWSQFVVIYTNKGTKIYKENYVEYLRLYQDYDEDEDEDEGEEEGENSDAENEAADASFSTYPVDTVFVKENYGSSNGSPGTPISLTIMVKKKPGYDPEFGDWFYIQSAPDGSTIMKGNSRNKTLKSACIDCHHNMNGRDYVFSTYFSKQPHSQ